MILIIRSQRSPKQLVPFVAKILPIYIATWKVIRKKRNAIYVTSKLNMLETLEST